MILDLPTGPKSAPVRVLVEMTGTTIVAYDARSDDGNHAAIFRNSEMDIATHATIAEIITAIRTAHNSGHIIAEVQHAYPAQEPE